MRLMCISAVFILLSGLSIRLQATMFGLWPPSLDAPGTLAINQWDISKVTIESRPSKTGFIGESYLLKVYGHGHLVKFPFDTTYGNFRVWIDNLTGGQSPEVILVASRGRGTSANAYFLDIYHQQPPGLVKVYEMQISGYFGPGDIWRYEVNFERRQNNVDFITLTLAVDEPYHGSLVAKQLIPKKKIMYIVWDEKFHKFILSNLRPSLLTRVQVPSAVSDVLTR